MVGKANWEERLHAIRTEEVSRAFSFLQNRRFSSGIEFGAGDGFQTTLLAPRCEKYVSSDLNFDRFKEKLKVSGVDYRTCDADHLDGVFAPESFDFVFSSSMIEHLSNPAGFLRATNQLLMREGIAVHVVPSRFLKVMYLLCFYPNLFLLVLDRALGIFKGKKVFRGADTVARENNLNAVAKRGGRWKKLLIPSMHGNYSSHGEEYAKSGKGQWDALFTGAGFEIVACLPGPVFSGYGFGLTGVGWVLKALGFSSEYIYILRKGARSSAVI